MFGLIGFLIGIMLVLFGFFLAIFFPNLPEHQGENFALAGIVIGIVLLIVGAALILL